MSSLILHCTISLNFLYEIKTYSFINDENRFKNILEIRNSIYSSLAESGLRNYWKILFIPFF